MNAAEKLGEFIEAIDFNPKLPILIEELPVPTMSIYLYHEDRIPKAYHISHLLEYRKANLFPEETAVYCSSFGVRLRAQIQFPEIELFPSVSVEHIGVLRDYILEMLEEGDQNDEAIDCEKFSQLSCTLWKKSKKQSFPVIRNLVSKDARYSAQILNKLKIKIQT